MLPRPCSPSCHRRRHPRFSRSTAARCLHRNRCRCGGSGSRCATGHLQAHQLLRVHLALCERPHNDVAVGGDGDELEGLLKLILQPLDLKGLSGFVSGREQSGQVSGLGFEGLD